MPVALADVDEHRARLSSRLDPTFGGMIALASDTGLPLRLTYNAPVRYPERPITAEERSAGLGAPWKEHVAEVAVDFEDFRAVSGRRFPHLIRKSAAGRTLQEITVSNIQLNPRLTRADFIPR
jgi:hypothetical protein